MQADNFVFFIITHESVNFFLNPLEEIKLFYIIDICFFLRFAKILDLIENSHETWLFLLIHF